MNKEEKLKEWLKEWIDTLSTDQLRKITFQALVYMIDTESGINFYPEEGKILAPYWDASGDRLDEEN